MTTHSGDGPLFSNTSIQWRSAILATVAVSRLRKSQILEQSTHQQGLTTSKQSDSNPQLQNGSPSRNHDTHSQRSQASHNEEANQAAPLDPEALKKAMEDPKTEVEVLKQIRDELVKQLDAYGLVLVLLAGITFVAILQPPGSFDNGKLQDSLLVSLFMLLATLSFFIACTALGAVMVGCAQLFRPFFHTKLAQYTDAVSKSWPTETPARQGCFIKWLREFWEVSADYNAIDNIDVLAKLCVENVYRIMRIRLYLGVALVLCIAAYICGALAVMVTYDRQRYLLVGAMGAGSVIVVFEICITLLAAMKPVAKQTRETAVELPK